MTYRRMLYIFAIIKQNHFKMYMFGIVGETHAHDYFEVISFNNSKECQRYITFQINMLKMHFRGLRYSTFFGPN